MINVVFSNCMSGSFHDMNLPPVFQNIVRYELKESSADGIPPKKLQKKVKKGLMTFLKMYCMCWGLVSLSTSVMYCIYCNCSIYNHYFLSFSWYKMMIVLNHLFLLGVIFLFLWFYSFDNSNLQSDQIILSIAIKEWRRERRERRENDKYSLLL